MQELRSGSTITESLRLVREIGRGGMGSVWVAYHNRLEVEVAVKFIDAALARGDRASLERFKREAHITSKLKSPHIAHTYDRNVLNDGTPYIVMELLEGESLQELIRRRGPLSMRETSLVVRQVAQALEQAHKMGIVHRDIKPGNIFLVDTGYDLLVKLLDFGIAKVSADGLAEAELTKPGSVLGSPLYMSPEQFTKARSVDHRTDLWSLAVVAYRCLSAASPFTGESLGEIITAVLLRHYRRITECCPGLPTAFDGWFAKAFHWDIEARFRCAKELATSFVEISQNATISGDVAVGSSIAASSHYGAAVEKGALSEPQLLFEALEGAAGKVVDEGATFAPAFTTLNGPKPTGRLVAGTAGAMGALVLVSVWLLWARLSTGYIQGAGEVLAPVLSSVAVPTAVETVELELYSPNAEPDLRPVLSASVSVPPSSSPSAIALPPKESARAVPRRKSRSKWSPRQSRSNWSKRQPWEQ